ncbi:Ger(x)C family spore germination protein [Clostridium sp. YIM B02551]|uniref:Ger(x)C family spore germination protein n=1 Tax=Clostridium sp. YIM B02551 TaxID=2910679 RepID=UPI001EEA525F
MRKLKRTIGLLMVGILMAASTGCYNYRDINKVTFVTSAILDLDPFDNVVIYLECINPYRNTNESSDKGKRIVYAGTGKTFLEAIRDVGRSSSYKINFTQNRAYIFTENAARKGLKRHIDLIEKDQELLVKPDMFVYYGSLDPLIKFGDNDEYLGLYLNELTQKMKTTPTVLYMNTSDYLSERMAGNGTTVIGGLRFKEDIVGKKLELSGGGIFKGDRLVQNINEGEGLSFNFLRDNVKSGTLEVRNPQDRDTFVTLEILKSKTKTDIQYDGQRVRLFKKIIINTSIAEAQGKLVVDENVINYIKTWEAENIKKHLSQVFSVYKNQNIDIFQVENRLSKKYSKVEIEDPIRLTDLIVDVDLNIEGTSKTKNSL